MLRSPIRHLPAGRHPLITILCRSEPLALWVNCRPHWYGCTNGWNYRLNVTLNVIFPRVLTA